MLHNAAMLAPVGSVGQLQAAMPHSVVPFPALAGHLQALMPPNATLLEGSRLELPSSVAMLLSAVRLAAQIAYDHLCRRQ